MTSRDELKKLFKEICIRFDTDPRRYSKFDFGALLKYIEGDGNSIDDIIASLTDMNISTSDLNSVLEELKTKVASTESEITDLSESNATITLNITNLLLSLSNLDIKITNNTAEITGLKELNTNINLNINSLSDRVTTVEETLYPLDGNFLDKRQGKAASIEDLKNWDFTTNPIPEGFEVCVDGTWYKYESDRTSETTGHFFPRLTSSEGSSGSFGAGVPVLDLEEIDNLSKENIPDKYIFIPTGDDLTPKKDGESLVDSTEQGYLLILFAAVKSLQALVTKLLNSFEYGILSYKDTDTAMSREASEDSDEPLWAIDEDNLEELEEIAPDLSSGTDLFTPLSSVTSLGSNTLKFTSTATWTADFSLYDYPKLFVYLTTEKLDDSTGRDIVIYTQSKETGSSNKINIDLSDLDLVSCLKYNIFVIVSRKLEVKVDDETTLKGYNYIWVSIKDYTDDSIIAEGYYTTKEVVDGETTVTKGYITEDPVYLSDRYTISLISFENLTLSKFNLYGKEEDFSHLVIPSEPQVSDYKNEAAHITIRSVASADVIDDISSLLLTDELVWSRKEKKLYIMLDGTKIVIGTASSSEEESTDNMTQNDLIELLYNAKVIEAHKDTAGTWYYDGLTDLAGFTLINDETGKKFDVTVDAYGNIQTLEVNTTDTLANKYEELGVGTLNEYSDDDLTILKYHIRGALGNRALGNPGTGIAIDKDLKLYADRIKIGAFYAPYKSDVTSGICGCSHAYIELENTSDEDFNLEGFYLYWVDTNDIVNKTAKTAEKLVLKGMLKAGSTFLIRGKLYANPDDANCFINVSTYDLEWYLSDGSLIDLSIDDSVVDDSGNITTAPYGIALLYGKDSLDSNYKLVKERTDSDTEKSGSVTIDASNSSFTYGYTINYVDSVYYSNLSTASSRMYKVGSTYCWAIAGIYIEKNSIYKNTFELDPAKQAFQGLTTVDSSRYRNKSLDDQDATIIRLWNEYITFPHSDYKIPVSIFTPKASFEEKNVSTDKTKLDRTKPNMVTCSFGIDMYKTRTFNWISCGLFDEYVWLKVGDTWKPFESYTTVTTANTLGTTAPFRKEFSVENNNTIYARLTGRFPGDGTFFASHKCILLIVDENVTTPTTYTYKIGRMLLNGSIDPDYCSDEYTFTLYPTSYVPRVYLTTDQQGFHWMEYQVWNAVAKVLNDLINDDQTNPTITGTLTEVLDSYYKGLDFTCPNNGTLVSGSTTETNSNIYTAVTITEFAENIKYYTKNISYNEVTGDFDSTVTYYTTEDEGVTYIAASNITEFASGVTYYTLAITYSEADSYVEGTLYYTTTFTRIYKYTYTRNINIMPVLVNTGDMTLNGTRINEWLDYYNGGIDLFKHLELVNIVGNNDLCGPDPEVLGTGDDSGKSNSYYFHLFYCYEINEDYIAPIINGKYIPSLYYLDSDKIRFVMINSEITETTCKTWFKLISSNSKTINAYTGWEIGGSNYDVTTVAFTPIYQMIKLMFDGVISDGVATKQLLTMCHEMPYTVITSDSLKSNDKDGYQNRYSRSIDKSNKLVGSHLNQMSTSDTHSLYWMSRLLDWYNWKYLNCKLMLGGHKHTFTATYPVRENYFYGGFKEVTIVKTGDTITTTPTEGTAYYSYASDGSIIRLIGGTEEGLLSAFVDGTTYYTGKSSLYDGPMEMPNTLSTDTVDFRGDPNNNLSKFPLTKRELSTIRISEGTFYPYTCVPNLIGGVVYFMCQASGFKLTSNKELPSTTLKFSYILPGLNGTKSANTLKFPMYATIDYDTSFKVVLNAVSGIMKPNMTTVLAKGSVPATPVFNMQNASNGNIKVYVYDPSIDWIRCSINSEELANNHTDCWKVFDDNRNLITLNIE